MSQASILLLQRRLSGCLIKPGGSLSFRSKIPLTNLQIQTQWREDVEVQIFHTMNNHKDNLNREDKSTSSAMKPTCSPIPNLTVTQQADKRTSLGRTESHLLLELNHSLTNHNDNNTYDQQPVSVMLQIPEQLNIDCHLEQGGSIDMGNSSKLEGDVNFSTTNGNLILTKLRGHDLSLLTSNGTIDVTQLLEAQSMQITANKIRAKRIHGTNIEIKAQQNLNGHAEEQHDDPAIDLSSLYVTGNGSALLDTTSLTTTTTPASSINDIQEPKNHCNHDDGQNNATNFKSSIRCHSHHGHVIALTDPQHGVELGGVNGSFDVDSHHASIHIDSLAPDSISIVSVNDRLTLTLDRKLNADLRLLNLIQETTTATTNASPRASSLARSECMMMAKDTKELEEGLYQNFNTGRYKSDDESNNLNITKSQEMPHHKISIATSAFTPVPFDSPIPNWDPNILFVQGYVENQHLEPDSRFELKTRGGGGGKIRLEGAQQQALQGFFSSPTAAATVTTSAATTTTKDVNKGIQVDRPLIIGSSEGGDRITVESLSWLGAIARRYGLEDEERQHRSPSQLGRQATRRGRHLVDVIDEHRE